MSVDSPESASDPARDADAPQSAEHALGTKQRFMIYMAISYCSMQGCIYVFHRLLDLNANLATWVAIVLVSLMNFFWLMCFVYRTADGHRRRQFWLYVQSIVGFRLWEAVVFYLLYDLLEVHYLVASTIMQAQSIVMKFVVYKKIIFRKHTEETDEELAVHAVPPNLSDK